jgi:succinoglycan biosynthesis transport protein ExoP
VNSVQPAYNAYPELAASDDLLQALLDTLDPIPENIESLQDLRGMVEAESGADPSMVRLAVTSRDPAEGARIANTWAGLFVARANDLYGAHSEDQVSFFEDQLERAQAGLETAEQALVAFQARNQGAILAAQLASARQDLQDYLVEQREIERAVRNAHALQDSIAGRPAGRLVSPGDDLTALLLQIQAFTGRTALDADSSLWLQVSETAPLSSERTVGELADFLDKLVTTLEARQEEITGQVTALEPQILALQQQLQESQTEEGRLTRARDVARETYMTMARKVEEVRIAADDASGEVQLASQAAIPERPVSPRKMVNTAVAGALGLMLGVFGVFALEWWAGDTGDKGQEETR